MESMGVFISFENKNTMMNAQNIAVADMLDIVFDGRNKAYGAYQLRRSYNKRMATAMGVVIFTASLIFVSSMLANGVKNDNKVEIQTIDLTLSDVEKEKPVIPPPVTTPPPVQQVRTVQVTVPIIVPDLEVRPEDELPPVEEIADAQIGLVTIDGPAYDGSVTAPPAEKAGTGLAEAPPVKVEDVNKVWLKVENPATFPGGFDAWKRFLEKNLIYPEAAIENGKQAKVRVQFIVDREGNISDVQALDHPGDGLEEEAVRIIKKGPKWIPAEQNGQKVIYRHIQNITFQLG